MEQPSDPLRICAYSGVEKPQSQMVQIGGHYVAIECKDEAVQYLQQGNELGARVHRGLEATPVQFVPMLSRSWALFAKHAWLLIALYLTVNVPTALLESYWTLNLGEMVESSMRYEGRLPSVFWLMILVPMATGIISAFGTAAVLAALSRAWTGIKPDYLSAWIATARRAVSVLAAAIAMMLLIIVGFLFCVIPGIIVIVKLAFCQCFVMDGGIGGVQSLGSSSRLTDGRFWIVLGNLLLVGIMTIMPIAFLMAGLQSLPWVSASWKVQGTLQAVLSVPAIFLTVFSFVFYKALREEASRPKPSVAP